MQTMRGVSSCVFNPNSVFPYKNYMCGSNLHAETELAISGTKIIRKKDRIKRIRPSDSSLGKNQTDGLEGHSKAKYTEVSGTFFCLFYKLYAIFL